jgi:type I restriction enzyme R subunit
VRFTYATNGQAIYGIDMETGRRRRVARYPSPDELWARLTFAKRNAWRDRFAAVPFEDKGGTWQGRYYQDIAITRVLAAIADGRDRILLTLATGTGKTFIAFQIAWKLFQSRWNLADWKKPSPRAARASCSWPTATSWPIRPTTPSRLSRRCAGAHRPGRHPQEGQGAEERQHLLHHLPDLHERPAEGWAALAVLSASTRRTSSTSSSSTSATAAAPTTKSNWRAILDYFAPAVQLGLTATPKRKDNADTYAYFGEPVLCVLAQGRHQRRLPDAVQGEADSPPRWTTTSTPPTTRWWRARSRPASATRKGLQQDHRDQGARGATGSSSSWA